MFVCTIKCLCLDNVPLSCKALFPNDYETNQQENQATADRLILGRSRAERQGEGHYIKCCLAFYRAKHFHGLTM